MIRIELTKLSKQHICVGINQVNIYYKSWCKSLLLFRKVQLNIKQINIWLGKMRQRFITFFS
jgi:hypothetical protein